MWVRVHIIQYRYINTIVKGMHISRDVSKLITYTLNFLVQHYYFDVCNNMCMYLIEE